MPNKTPVVSLRKLDLSGDEVSDNVLCLIQQVLLANSSVTTGKHGEFHLNWNVTTLRFFCMI